jgi:YD repeat-containing protein
MTARWIAILGLSICALAVSGEAEAQAYPAACKPAPGGYADCRSKIPSPYWFYGGGCGNAGYYSSGGAAQSAYESLDKPFVGGGCTVTTWNDKGLLASHANVPRASFSFGCPTGDNYLVPNYTDGLEIENYRRYSIAYGINPPACDVLRQPYDQATYGQFRSVYCPRGTTNFFSACARQTIEVEKNLGKQCPSCGNPISPGIGNKFQEEVDYAGVAGSPLKFVRFYNSSQAPKLRRNTHFSYSMIYDLFGQDVFSFYSSNQAQSSFWNRRAMQSIGGNWTHNYMRSISVMTSTNENGSTPATEGLTTAYVYRGDGRMLAFNKYLGQWVGDADVIDTLADGPSGSLVYYDAAAEESETYDATGQLKEIRTRDGVVLTLAYDSNSRLLSVTDSWGHAITFQYEPGGGLEPRNRIARVVDPAGGIHEYQYLASGALEKVIYPNATSRTYTYLGGESAYLLTGIKDENNIQIGTYGYDGEGRATSTQGAGGLNQHTLTHTVPSDLWAGSVSILDPLGVTRTYEYVANNGVARLASITQPAASGAGTVTESYSYDTRGNLLRKKDFNGNSTCFEYDSGRNLETYRVEGFAPGVSSCPASLAAYTPTPGTRERKIATVWHSSYRLPMSITEANRTTSFTRDSSGRPTTRTVTDTSVTPNVARTWTYTYNVFGKVLTENGPRTDVTDLTTYVYYTCTTGYQCGQVNTITNALGHVTTYNSYNAHGRPTQITDANGLVTALAYDSRQRLTDRCIGGTLPGCAGGELTHLDYWPTGLLKKVTNPDSSFIEYVYDNAHRLVEIKDGALNKIVYTLDTVGNRTAENTYDPSSALKRTHTRVYNSLNQLWKDVNAAGTAAVTTVFGYDDIGNQKTVNAPLGRNSTSLYDELSRLQQITDPASGNTLFGYDANDNLTTVTDPRSLVTSYTYTGFGDLKRDERGIQDRKHDRPDDHLYVRRWRQSERAAHWSERLAPHDELVV